MCGCQASIALLADVKPGDVVLDPMLGGGSLLLQAIELPKRCFAIGGDIMPAPVALASANLAAGSMGWGHELRRADTAARSSPTDVMVADVRHRSCA